MRRAQRALKRAQDQAEAAQRHCLISNENADVCEAITTDMMRWWTWARDLELFAVEWREKAQKKYVPFAWVLLPATASWGVTVAGFCLLFAGMIPS